jgi:glycerophosphoryl diester phosphodiesterase
MKWIPIFWCLIICSLSLFAQEILYNAHGHNDYEKNKPLFKALNNGFSSIEIDLFAHKGKLVVSHVNLLLDSKPLLLDLYIKPLAKLIEQNNGLVYANDSTQLVLYFDFKTPNDTTYAMLRKELAPYRDFFTVYYQDSVVWGPLQLLVNGPLESIANETVRWVSVSGTFQDIGKQYCSALMPRVHFHYKTLFKWNGKGKMPEDERVNLHRYIESAHAENKTVRIYAIPNKKRVWKELMDAEVDWINVDRYRKFRNFYRSY